MSERERRIAANEALFRSVNEQVQRLNDALRARPVEALIVCECGNTVCTERIEVTNDEWADVRADPAQFMVKPMHAIPDTETVVSTQDRFWIVRKVEGLAADLARATDGSDETTSKRSRKEARAAR